MSGGVKKYLCIENFVFCLC